MCFYDQRVFGCGGWAWSNFVAHCSPKYRTGETCGMKLVHNRKHVDQRCKLCEKVEIKYRRRKSEQDRIARWRAEGRSMRVAMEKSSALLPDLEREIKALEDQILRSHGTPESRFPVENGPNSDDEDEVQKKLISECFQKYESALQSDSAPTPNIMIGRCLQDNGSSNLLSGHSQYHTLPSWQEKLQNHCKLVRLQPAIFKVVSERRGGRTGWSCEVTVQGRVFHARFFYGFSFIDKAKEDAAEVALMHLGAKSTERESMSEYSVASSTRTSILSMPTLPSTAITGSILLGPDEVRKATDELISIFLDDQDMKPLYTAAILDGRVGPERFARNYKRLLKAFSLRLKDEAHDATELGLANLIFAKAGFVASNIRRMLDPSIASPGQPFPCSKGNGPSPDDIDTSSDDEQTMEPKENFAALVALGRNFIMRSDALELLRKDLRAFVMPLSKKSIGSTPEIVAETPQDVSPMSLYLCALNLERKTYRNVLAALSELGLRERDIPPGQQRFRWTNGQGRMLYDDYIEHEPGALRALQDYVSIVTCTSQTVPMDPRSNTLDQSGSATSLSNYSEPANSFFDSHTSVDIDHEQQPAGKLRSKYSHNDIEQGRSSGRALHLFSCTEYGRHAVKLHQENITDIPDDRDLFHTLRQRYHEHRGKLRPYWSLKTIHSIHFMKFIYGGRRYVDVRCHNDICQQGKSCDCIPPPHLVHPNGTEYECRPVPSKLSPPIGPRLMMDFFSHPELIAPNSSLVLNQLPKRSCGTLESLLDDSVVEAWGIFYQEDWDWLRIWWLITLGFLLPGLLFGILWGVLKKDIQGSFGVASWWMAAAMTIVGILGTYSCNL